MAESAAAHAYEDFSRARSWGGEFIEMKRSFSYRSRTFEDHRAHELILVGRWLVRQSRVVTLARRPGRGVRGYVGLAEPNALLDGRVARHHTTAAHNQGNQVRYFGVRTGNS